MKLQHDIPFLLSRYTICACPALSIFQELFSKDVAEKQNVHQSLIQYTVYLILIVVRKAIFEIPIFLKVAVSRDFLTFFHESKFKLTWTPLDFEKYFKNSSKNQHIDPRL